MLQRARTAEKILTFVIPTVVGVTVGGMLSPALGGLPGTGTPFVSITFPKFGQIQVIKFHRGKEYSALYLHFLTLGRRTITEKQHCQSCAHKRQFASM